MRACESEFCAIHDDDDLWEPQFLERTVEFMDSSPATEMVAVRIIIVYEEEADGEFVETGRAPFWGQLQAITIEDLLVINRIVPIGLLHRRRLHDEIGWFNETLPVVGDWEFNLRVASRHEIELIDEPLAYWCQRPAATGAAANSVFDLGARHRKHDLLVRAAAIRDDLAQGGHLGPYLFQAHLAHELTRHLDERLDRLAAEQSEAIGRGLDALEQRLERLEERERLANQELRERLEHLERLIVERTSLVHFARRGFRKTSQRQTGE